MEPIRYPRKHPQPESTPGIGSVERDNGLRGIEDRHASLCHGTPARREYEALDHALILPVRRCDAVRRCAWFSGKIDDGGGSLGSAPGITPTRVRGVPSPC